MKSQFLLDKQNAKVAGVCAGLARSADIDPLLVRLGTVLLTFLLGPVIVLAYAVAALVAEKA